MALISCPECGGKLSDKAPACPHCGAAASLLLKETVVHRCAECGNTLPEDAEACPVCGFPVGAAAPVPCEMSVQPVRSAPVIEDERFEIVLAKGKIPAAHRKACIVLSIPKGHTFSYHHNFA